MGLSIYRRGIRGFKYLPVGVLGCCLGYVMPRIHEPRYLKLES